MCFFEHEIEEINRKAVLSAQSFILEAESAYRSQLQNAASRVCERSGRQIVMIAGPSSSGKTTTAEMLREMIIKNGREAVIVSLDDFYFDQTMTFRFEDGTPDFETDKAIDVQMAADCLNLLARGEECMLPSFSFITKRRESKMRRARLSADGIVIAEGLHAINPVLTDKLKNGSVFKIYVSVSSRVRDRSGILLSKRELRLVRRLIRDEKFRNSPALNTLYLWRGVRMGEDRYIFPFSPLADMKIDSFHPCEPCIFKESAVKLLDRVGADSVYFNDTRKIIEALSAFESIPSQAVPENSLLREFIGHAE